MKPIFQIPLLLLTGFVFSDHVIAACTPTQVLRDDVLVVVNDNSKSSPVVGDYYCEQRGIEPNNVAHVRVPVTNDIQLDQFISLRDQLIKHMLENTLPSGTSPAVCDTTKGYSRYYCPESTDQLRQNSSIRYLVMTKGLPIRFNFSGSSVAYNPEASIDNYLRFWLTNYFSQDVNFTINNRAIDFSDGRGMREVSPIIDQELIVGRIDGVDTESAKRLVDRAINAEKNGIFGKLYGDKFTEPGSRWKSWQPSGGTETVYPSSDYLHGLFGELQGLTDPATNPAIRHTINLECLSYDLNGKIPKECVTAVKPASGSEPAPGTPNGRIPSPDNALVHQSYLGTFSLLETFDDLLNWRDSVSCNTLCENDTSCKAVSTDAYKEIDTRCVRVADGHIGYMHKSYPIGMMTAWPTGWFQGRNIHEEKFDLTGGSHYYYWQPEVRNETGIGFDDDFSLWFRNSDNNQTATCYTGTVDFQTSNSACDLEKRININQAFDIQQRSINISSPQKITIKFKYRAINLNKDVSLNARLMIRETPDGDQIGPNNQVVYLDRIIKTLSAPNDPANGGWGDTEITFTLDPTLHKHPQNLFDAIKIRVETAPVLESHFEGELAFDNFSVELDGVPFSELINPSFNEGHQQLSGGDTATTFLSRLNGVAFWANISHHEGNGNSFNSHPLETLIYFFRGLPLGDAVWFAETHNSGMFYGDPLYSPIAVHLNYLTAKDSWARDKFSTTHDSLLTLTGHTVNGTNTNVTTTYSVDYCYGEDDFLICDQNDKWSPIAGMQNRPGGQREMPLGNWDISSLLEGNGNYVLRLAVTSSNPTKGSAGLTQTFYDYYPVNLYTPGNDDDKDGLTYEQELGFGTNPNSDDTDTDTLPDKYEVEIGLDPLTDNTDADTDGDGVNDITEFLRNTDPTDSLDFPAFAEHVVDPVNGNDDNDQTPFKTIAAAINSAEAGDKILLNSGNYDTDFIYFSTPVHLQGPLDQSAVFESAFLLSNTSTSTVVVSDLTFRTTNLDITGNTTDNTWKFIRNSFSSNTTINRGSSVEFENNVFTNASSEAIDIRQGASTTLINNTITGNDIGVKAESDSSVQIINCIISDNASADIVGITPDSISYSLTGSASLAGSNGNITGDPYFVDPQIGDFHLKPESPAIDAGDPQSDFSNEPPSAIGRINLGRYGNTTEATPKAASENSSGSSRISWLLLLWLSVHGLWRIRRNRY